MNPPTLRDDIPGLLRRWAPIVFHDTHGFTEEPRRRRGVLAPDGRVALDDGSLFRFEAPDYVSLDIDDPTGRSLAVAWCLSQTGGALDAVLLELGLDSFTWAGVQNLALRHCEMPPRLVRLLACAVHRLAKSTGPATP